MIELPNRIYGQYRDKPKAKAFLEIANNILANNIASLEHIINMYDIDKATGEDLRIIGRIVVLDRAMQEELMNAGVFGKGTAKGTQFNDRDQLFAKWSTYVDAEMDDSFLRLMIRAKIVKNSSIATIDSQLDALNFLFPTLGAISLINHKDMSFTVVYVGQITPLEKFLIDNVTTFIPTPQGVECKGFKYVGSAIPFMAEYKKGHFGDKTKEFYGEDLLNGNRSN